MGVRMLKKIITLSAFVLSLGFSAAMAQEQEKPANGYKVTPYASFKIAGGGAFWTIDDLFYSDSSDDFDAAIASGRIGIGAQIHPNIRIEAEYSIYNSVSDTVRKPFLNLRAKSQLEAMHSFMGIIYVDIFDAERPTAFKPYLGLGLGGAYTDYKITLTDTSLGTSRTVSDDKFCFGLSLMGGLGYQVSPNVIMDIGLRIDTIDFEEGMSVLTASAGVRIPF